MPRGAPLVVDPMVVRGRLAGILTQLAGIGLLLTSGWLIVRAAQQPPVLFLLVAIVGVRFFGVARAGLRYLERLWTHDAAFARAVEERVAVQWEVDRIAPRALTGRRRGDLVSRVVADVDRLVDRDVRLVLPWVVAIGSTAVVAGLLAWLVDPAIGAVVGLSGVVTMVALRVLVPWWTRSATATSTEVSGDLAAVAAEAVRCAPDLVVLGATSAVREAVRRDAQRLAAAQVRGAWGAGAGSALVLALTGATMAAVALLTEGLDPVLVGVAVLAPLALAEALDGVAEAERLRPGIVAARTRLEALGAAPSSIVDRPASRELPSGTDLRLVDVVVGWDAPVAGPVTVDLPAGSVTAVSGPSGSGKSTLAMTVGRLLEPLSGQLLLDGVDVTALDPDAVRTVVGYLGQDDVVLDTTLRENLRVADPVASDEAMLGALRRAGLGAFVAGLRDGLETPLGEGGRRMSGGERRRLSLARLLLGGHRVLVVDEPTEHLDVPTGDALVTDLLALAPERTVVVVTHAPRVLARIERRVSVSTSHTATGGAAQERQALRIG